MVDITNKIQYFLSVKDQTDLLLLKKSANVTNFFFEKLVEEIELVVDEGIKTTHISISDKMDKYQEKHKKTMK